MERAAGEDVIADKNAAPIAGVPTTGKKRKTSAATDDGASSGTGTGTGGICDDTVGTILARLPARTAIACTALSKRHRSLIRSPEFRSLHCRLGAPLPSPHVAYLATAPMKRRPEHDHPASQYYGFHLAGSGTGLTTGGGDDGPIRSVVGWRYVGTKYVNTCNGVLLIATKGFSVPCRCTLWNPAVDDAARQATISISEPTSSEKKTSEPISLPDRKELRNKKTQFLVLGLGYGRRSNTYKLLLCRRDRYQIWNVYRDRQGKITRSRSGGTYGGPGNHSEYSLVVHSLGGSDTDDDKETRLTRVVLSMDTVVANKEEVQEEILKRKLLYMDGTIYIVYSQEKVTLCAFDVDNETVHTIDMPGNLQEAYYTKYQLIVMNGHRPCLMVTAEQHCIALCLITADYQLEPIHVISYSKIPNLYLPSIVGAWDCGSVVLLLLNRDKTTNLLLLYDVTEKKVFRANMPSDLAVQKADYMLCWGYKPTLVSPESIVGEFSQDMERWRGHSANITDVINPLLLQDRRKGQKATLNTVCLMEFLVRIMQKLPQDLQDVLEMPKMDSDELGSLFQ